MTLRSSKKILAVSSGGGHWVELLRLVPAFDGWEVVYATVSEAYRSDIENARFHVVRDATRWNWIRLVELAVKLCWVMWSERPGVVITTGAAPGYFALRLGKLIGARTVWVDSVANVEELSMSGQMAGRYADLWLTQWAHLARSNGPHYKGRVF